MKYIPLIYSGNPIQCNIILIGCLCVLLIALSKLNFNIYNTTTKQILILLNYQLILQ
jgi:hypothetical protein